jgi:hypothetical protein
MARVIAMALHMDWHVVDAVDGDRAPLTACSSAIDGLSDDLRYIVLGVLLQAQAGGGALFI